MAAELLSGNQAVGEAVRLAKAQVVSAYPITPQTTIVEHLAELIGSRRLAADYITVESEHSAMAACIGASLAGARTFTATSSQGLALMHEMLHWASGQRAPIVMANVNRALAPPWNIWVDHSDSMSQRDTGWIQLYAETNQEALDTVLQAFRVAEDPSIMLPAMVMLDAFVLSHTYMPVELPDARVVDRFLPSFSPVEKLTPGSMQLFGSFSPPNLCFMELRSAMAEAMGRARGLLLRASKEYAELTGRPALGLVEEYRTEGADVVLLAAGSLAATARDAVDLLQNEGKRVGLVRVRAFRPFPEKEVRALGRRFGTLGVLDRAYSYGAGGPIASEVRAALYGLPRPPRVASFILGLGGRDVRPDDLVKLYRRLLRGETPKEEWVGLHAPAGGT
ncbi:MAG: pyruvate ferredoxin oxidoreductase [Euryarchaeota archaeon]|nr:pyruvate ferredoxin oxidoreductase [Euryarchaeota archaeon]MDE1835085.1 pyruvate ferredoxin oxidoreductase [Euryarchaeota archaeon]MDE1879357.1 pyruvate ferredoxin oxidoreductase [Euryarchaeota archaeon]MDE2044952.1 pyruvate ferredoxin oxidoreductase [Thermoplasmata archaeon]